MEIFICWSGLHGRAAAKAIDQWLPKLVPEIKVFYSEQIQKGSVWFGVIAEQLRHADAGLICVTAESVRSPWLNYEAGVLAGRLKAGGQRRIYTYLIGLDPRELEGSPLAAYQSTLATYEDTGRLLEVLAGRPLPEYCQSWWHGFSGALQDVERVSLERIRRSTSLSMSVATSTGLIDTMGHVTHFSCCVISQTKCALHVKPM
jgi:TIR domain